MRWCIWHFLCATKPPLIEEGCLLALALLSSVALSKPSIQTKIISGGEVTIMEVEARYDLQSIAVSGKGFEIFPRQTCGYAEIVFVDVNERIIHADDRQAAKQIGIALP
jgi:hypothetical protein